VNEPRRETTAYERKDGRTEGRKKKGRKKKGRNQERKYRRKKRT
jgi:hypothetical protein